MSRDVAATRMAALSALKKVEGLFPQLMHRHRAEHHEGHARHHAAVAVAQFRQWQLASGGVHAATALAHAIQTP